MPVRALAVVGAFLAISACQAGTAESVPSPRPEPSTSAYADTEGSAPPPPAMDASVDGPLVPSACPAPAVLGPADVPAGFLPAVKVTIAGIADGDSGRYDFPNAKNQGVRMLFVNTEESFGDDMTDFGVQTKATVIAWITAAKDIRIAVREASRGSGTPDLDPYDRWLSLVFLDGELLQTRLVREGLSAYYTQFGCATAPIHQSLLYAEAEANANQRGIWGPGPHNDYRMVLKDWIGTRTCRPNPYLEPYCK